MPLSHVIHGLPKQCFSSQSRLRLSCAAFRRQNSLAHASLSYNARRFILSRQGCQQTEHVIAQSARDDVWELPDEIAELSQDYKAPAIYEDEAQAQPKTDQRKSIRSTTDIRSNLFRTIDPPKHRDLKHTSHYVRQRAMQAQATHQDAVKPPDVAVYHDKDTVELYRLLRSAGGSADLSAVNTLVDMLIRQRDQQPDIRHYSALIAAQAHPSGSAALISHYLSEMSTNKISATTEIQHYVLRALAVHPDFLTRSEILSDMRKRWLELSAAGWHDVCVSCLREGSLELAFEYLDEMRLAKVTVQGWLYDMFLFRLCDASELDQTLRLLTHRASTDEASITPGIWYHIFDAACGLIHHETLSYIWHQRISTLYLNPTNGQCLSVLMSASRHGDVSLATDVFRVLSERDFVFTTAHYELLLQAYLQMPDLKTALTITCIMAGAQLSLSPSALSPILVHLKTDPALPMQALAMCQSMVSDEGRSIPTPVLTCLIEASIYHGGLSNALTIYKTLHTLCLAGPDVDTFNALFRGCHYAAELAYKGTGATPVIVRERAGEASTTSTPAVADASAGTQQATNTPPPKLLTPADIKGTAMFLAAEMVHLHILPTGLTYDRLLLCCLHQKDCSDAFRYYVEMREMGYWPRPGTWDAMVRRLREEAVRERRGEMSGGVSDEEEHEEQASEDGDGNGEKEDQGGVPKIKLDRPLERAWALVSVMRERRLPTARLEQLLMDV